jgi:hypothetical protein
LMVTSNIRCSYQRWTFIYQVHDHITKTAVCQATDKQYGSTEAAFMAIWILHELWKIGATKADLRRIKAHGLLDRVRQL